MRSGRMLEGDQQDDDLRDHPRVDLVFFCECGSECRFAASAVDFNRGVNVTCSRCGAVTFVPPAIFDRHRKHPADPNGAYVLHDWYLHLNPPRPREREERAQRSDCVRILRGHNSDVNAVVVTPDGRYAVSGSGTYLLEVDQPSGEKMLVTLEQADVSDLRKVDQTIRLWDLSSGLCVRTISDPWLLPVYSLALLPSGKRVLSCGMNIDLRLWDLDTGGCLCVYGGILGGLFKGHKETVTGVALTPDGRYAVSSSNDRTLRLWDIAGSVASGKNKATCLRTFKGHRGAVTALAITPDGRNAVSGGDDKTLRVWDLESGACLSTFQGHEEFITAVAITRDGQWVISSSVDTTVRLWELASGSCVRTFSGHANSVNAIALTPDGGHVLSGSADRTLKLWDVTSGLCVRTFVGHEDAVLAVSVTPDGDFALTGSKDKTLRLWSIAGK